jgi:hypothetical protein
MVLNLGGLASQAVVFFCAGRTANTGNQVDVVAHFSLGKLRWCLPHLSSDTDSTME